MFLLAFLCVVGILFLPLSDCMECTNQQQKYDSTTKSNFSLIDDRDVRTSNHRITSLWLEDFDSYYRSPILDKCFQYIDDGLFMGILGYSNHEVNKLTYVFYLTIHDIEYTKACNFTNAINTSAYAQELSDDKFTADETVILTYNITQDTFTVDEFQLIFVSNESITYVISTACNAGHNKKTGFRSFLLAVGYYKYCPFDITCSNQLKIVEIEHKLCTRRPVTYTFWGSTNYKEGSKIMLPKPFLFFSSYTDHIMVSSNGALSISSVSNGYKSIPNEDTVFVMDNIPHKDSYWGKEIYFKYQTTPLYLTAANNDVSKFTLTPFKATKILIFTDLKSYTSKQAIFATDDTSTYVILNYQTLENDGMIGYSEVSCGSKVLFDKNSSQMVMQTSNIGVPGRHVFRLTQDCTVADMYPFGSRQGDQSLPVCDNCTEVLSLKTKIPLKWKKISKLYINSDGYISEGHSIEPNKVTREENELYFQIAAYHLDFDTTLGGAVYFRETGDDYIISRANADIKFIYPEAADVTNAVIVTYDNMAAHNDTGRNSFQVVIGYNNLTSAYLIIIYKYLMYGNALAMFKSLPCSRVDVTATYEYENAFYLVGNQKSNKRGKYIYDLHGENKCNEVCRTDTANKHLAMLDKYDLKLLKKTRNTNKHSMILKKIYPRLTEKLYMTVFANSYDHLTINRTTYIESCNIGTILQAQQSIRDFDMTFTPQDVVKVSYYINSNLTEEQKFEITFASNKNATYVIMSRCTLGPGNIHAIGYFKNCSFAITCKYYVETKFIEHNKCGKHVTLLYPTKEDKKSEHVIESKKRSRCSWEKPFLLFSTEATSITIEHSYISIEPEKYTSTDARILLVYDVTEEDVSISSTVYCEYTENTNLIRAANMDVSNHTLTPFSAKHLLLVTFSNVKKGIWDPRYFTFQAVLASDGNETFAILNYFKLEGDATYIGHEEEFCLNSIFYQSLGSTELVHTSNVGIPGRHVFKLTSEIGCIRATLYPHGETSGDLVMPKGDNLVEKLKLNSPLELNTGIIHDIFLSTNALISTKRLSSSTDYHLYVQYPNTIIAPYNLDYDTRISGEIYYRETKEEHTLKLASMDIDSAFGVSVNITSAIVVTYLDIASKNAPLLKDTFQVVIAYNDNGDAFLILIFKQLKNPSGLVMFSESSCCSINVNKLFNYGDARFLSGHTNTAEGLGKFVIDLKRDFTDVLQESKQKQIYTNTIGYDFIKISWEFEANNPAIITLNVVGEWETKWKYLSCDVITSDEFHNLIQNKTYKIELIDANGSLPAVVLFSPEKIGAVSNVSIRQNGHQSFLYWKTPVVKFGNPAVAKTFIKHTMIESGKEYNSLISSSIYESQYSFSGEIGSEHTFVITLAIRNQLGPSETITYTFVETAESSSTNIIIIATTSVCVVLLVFLAMVLYYRKKMKRRNKFLFTQTAYKLDPDRSILEQCNNLTYDTKFEFPRKHISLFRVLGEGAFGQVWMASAKQMENFKPRQIKKRASLWKRYGTKKKTFVAVKTLKAGATESDYKDLANELKLLIHLGEHRNIVNLLGACTRDENLLVILEYCSNGAVLNYLRLNRDDFEASWYKQNNEIFNLYQITWVAVQIADGMNFLEEKKVTQVLLFRVYIAI
ncbi:uncharacterized protein LOC130646248 isoform X2 [Hydractinia symbiolongicarpus]|uniref:uncharacterized protein LOC130646248 isoform X2 n=1 Tax=Hydractinia symbiolongicarpus TaxID=13093 RepID=UPI00254AB5BC|nr:uncharacterized protein LOC130646248 isoform X2 [Hydractinia symbiolongicarpus]